MKKSLEKMSILSLSLMLISSFSVSSALPLMLRYYVAYSADQVGLLISVPSFSVLVLLLCNGFLIRYVTERQMIVTGLLLMSMAGVAPVFYQGYWFVLLSRILFGVGAGLINAKAISMISERFDGRERVQLLGLRSSAEVVGAAFLTLFVGQMIRFDWTWGFAGYGFSVLILFLYLFFVPDYMVEEVEVEASSPAQLNKKQLGLATGIACLAGFSVCINSSINLQIPLMVTGRDWGSPSLASFLLMGQQLIGIVSGLVFVRLLEWFERKLLGIAYLGLGGVLLGIAFAPHLSLLGLMTIASGFLYSIIMTSVFQVLSEHLPARLLNRATALVLVGCSLGAACSPYVVMSISLLSSATWWLFAVYGLACLFLGSILLGRQKGEKNAAR